MQINQYTHILFILISLQLSYKISKCNPVLKMNLSNRKFRMDNHTYFLQRQAILSAEAQERIGGEVVLNADEMKVNDILMAAKRKEIQNSLTNGAPFPPEMHFFHAKPYIDSSEVFKLIRMMPKGGVLHLHDVSMADPHWLVQNLTYHDNCYMCRNQKNEINFHFWSSPPQSQDCPWKKVNDLRSQSGNISHFDQMLFDSFVLNVDDPQSAYPSINAVWKKFEGVLDRANGLIEFGPAFKSYFLQGLQEFYDDNVQYIELRAVLPPTYELDGTQHNMTWLVETYQNATREFLQSHPDFTGTKLIHTGIRFVKEPDIMADVKDTIALMKQFPGFLLGYDLVGQEDPGKPLLYYLEALLYPSRQNPPVKLPYFFHAGETDWQGTRVDDNLVDAVILNTTRIGHGYAIPKHPEIMKIVKQKQIAVEVNPISNQVLKLVDDLRNHPAAVLIDQGFPIVISCDDPAVWGAKGLSYDFYEAFMGLAGQNADLRLLKQLAINSLRYSAMPETEKIKALNLWKGKWDTFIKRVLQRYSRKRGPPQLEIDKLIIG